MRRLTKRLKYYIYRIIEKSTFNNKVRVAFQDLYRLNGEVALIMARNKSKESINLWDYEVKIYSQWGEDGILDHLTEKLDLYKPKILEIGVGNFTECNSKALVEYKNASAYLVDIDQNLESSLNNSPLKWKSHLGCEIVWVNTHNVNSIVENASNFMNGINVISLDIDGVDYWVLKEMNIPSEVQVIVVEYNPLFGPSHKLTVPLTDNFERESEHYSHLYFGCSILAWIELLENRKFTFVGTNRVGNNAFFVKDNKTNCLSVSPQENFEIYTDWRIRESRNFDGQLDYLSLEDGRRLLSEKLVVDLVDGSLKPLKEFL